MYSCTVRPGQWYLVWPTEGKLVRYRRADLTTSTTSRCVYAAVRLIRCADCDVMLAMALGRRGGEARRMASDQLVADHTLFSKE
jgi:hypothetical protein